MVYKTKTYVAFDGDEDMGYYNLLKAWSNNNSIDFDLHDAHILKQARDSSLPETIQQSLRERIRASKVLILIVGDKTHHHTKFVKYEIEYAKSLNIPIILAVISDGVLPLSWFEDYPALQVPFKLEAIKDALQTWPAESERLRKEGRTGFLHYEN